MLNYTQNKNGTYLKFEFVDNGINFTLKDKTIHKTDFIPFEDITNKTHEYFEKNEGHKNRALYFLVVGILFLIANIIFKAKLWAWLFLLGAPVFYFLYKKSIVNYTVLNTDSNMNIWVLDDNNQEKIINEIFSRRNDYLMKNYLEIDFQNDMNTEINKFYWLLKLELINNNEFEIIKEEILNHSS